MAKGAPDLGCWRPRASIGDGGMGFAISPENFRRAADMRRAINGPCRPTALAFLGVDERDAVDLEESLGLFDEIRTSGLGLRTLFHELFRGSWSLGILALLPGPGSWVAEIGASRQAVIAAKAHAASRP